MTTCSLEPREQMSLPLLIGKSAGFILDLEMCRISWRGSVLPETRRNIEKDALQEYYGFLRSSSVEDFTYDECWRQYRAHTLDGLILLVFACGGLELAEENDRHLVEMGLKRMLAATEDLDAEEFLSDRSRFWRLGSSCLSSLIKQSWF